MVDISGDAVLVVDFVVEGLFGRVLQFLKVVGTELCQVVLFRV